MVSVCFGDLPGDTASFDEIAELARNVDNRFRFREIIVVIDESQREAYLPLVQRVDNLRLFTVRDGTGFYRRRMIAADEAIGDVVLMTSVLELSHVDPVAMITRAADDQCAVLATRSTRLADHTLAAPLIALGRIAGFRVSLRNLQSLAVPRTLINQLLAHPDPDLALRFPPSDLHIPLEFFPAATTSLDLREVGQLARRLALMQKLLVYVAPSLLKAVSLTSALLALLGLIYAMYVVVVWIVLDDIAPGWLTLSIMLSLTALFLGISILGLSLGMQQLLIRSSRDDFDGVSTEINRIDLFGQVASELNVELERDLPMPDHEEAVQK